ncbi:16S rRNA (guanine(966)-N(2))-methyltransferase RsmD [Porphyromonas sp.]|uniref:16S rRNA (guanine(966)-N(2))-methyltransferase RsmD n=1 Tax=Porphyromonas sp. TaxID=1924944 RepID=UPI0026DD0A73|nr:16S rRNA (guanine(966)-N(2))-methyltransferase RsmD [Porphyromonas sp.]MDO4771720.1 16S rRNA (guanine(966)-N(2))-methyltransferase RsmD [Porphyromonas sp.]
MRIIRGKYGRRRFSVPKTFKARPTTDFAKENLFNILENSIDWEETSALDLFAGTGSIGLELLSRGCRTVTAVEMDHAHCTFIREVVGELKDPNYRLIKGDAFKYIANQTGERFDFIFADPPYAIEELGKLPDLIMGSTLLAPDGLFILEHPGTYDFSEHPAFVKLKKYGSVHFSFFEHPAEVSEQKEFYRELAE